MALLVNGQRVAGLGSPGVGIKSIERTGGDGTPGTDDIYTITMTDGKTSEFSVHNGADGTDGIDGVTPHVGDNGNWWIGETDTGIVADMEAEVDTHNNDTAAHADIRAELAAKTNRNLLHNWYFANPVNQRGQTEYTAQGYGPDRWMLANPFTVNCENGLTLTPNELDNRQIHQRIEHPGRLAGKKVTLSVLISSNALSNYAVFGIYANGTAVATNGIAAGRIGVFSLTTTMPDNIESAYVRLGTTTSGAPTGAITFEAVKLELGDTQTLAHQDADGNWVLNEIPDYGEELAKCQRYQIFGEAQANAYLITTNGLRVFVPTPVTMRANPEIFGTWEIINRASGAAVEGFSISSKEVRPTGISLVISKASHGLTSAYFNLLSNAFFDANL